MSELYANSEPITISSVDWVPTAPYTRTSAVLCITGGILYCDFLGTATGTVGNTNQGITMTTGQVLPLAILKARHASSTGTYLALY
jgi:hypothetical protein